MEELFRTVNVHNILEVRKLSKFSVYIFYLEVDHVPESCHASMDRTTGSYTSNLVSFLLPSVDLPQVSEQLWSETQTECQCFDDGQKLMKHNQGKPN